MQGSDDIDLVNKQCVLVLSRNFTAKRVRTSEWKKRKRGAIMGGRSLVDTKSKRTEGKGAEHEAEEGDGADAEEEDETTEDALAGVFCCHDFDALLVFSEHGMCYMLQAVDVPLAKKMSAPGTELTQFLPELENHHHITALVTVSHVALRDQTDEFIVLISARGLAKKVNISKFKGLRPGKGIVAMGGLEKDDELRWAHKASADSALVLATTQGYVLRCSIGADWPPSSTKAPGKLVMKMRAGQGDRLAATGISKLSEKEIAKVAADKAKRQARQAAKEAAAARFAQGSDAGDAAAATLAAATEGQSGADSCTMASTITPVFAAASADNALRRHSVQKKRTVATCDDDDSDNEVPAVGAAPLVAAGAEVTAALAAEAAAGPAATAATAEADESDNGGDAGASAESDGDGEEGESDAEKAKGVQSSDPANDGEGAGAAQDGNNTADVGQCTLLVTQQGYGIRMPLESKRMVLRKRGGAGLVAIKVFGHNRVISACIVSGKTEIPEPAPAKSPFDIWSIRQAPESSTMDSDMTKAPEAQQVPESSAVDVQKTEVPEAQQALGLPDLFEERLRCFNALPEEEQQVYAALAEEDKQRFAAELEAYQREDVEEVLLGSEKGLILRVAVGAIPIAMKALEVVLSVS